MVESAPCTNHDLSDIDRQQIPTHSPAGRDALLASQAEHSPDHENEDDAPDGLEGLSEYTLEELRDLSDEVDYYAVLGLPRDPVPTDAQIRSAYHTISLTFHPDKHCESSFLAREQFAAIENAYATLIDPQKRVVYDLLGAAGVQREWTRDGVMYAYAEEKTIGVRAMDPREFKAWFLYKMKQRERAVLEDMVASRTTVTLGLRAISIFPSESESVPFTFKIPRATPSSYFVSSSFKIPLMPISRDQSGETGETRYGDEGHEDASSSGPIQNLELFVNASVGGPLKRFEQDAVIENLETGEKETRKYLMPPSIFTRAFALGLNTSFSLREEPWKKKGLIRSIMVPFRGSGIDCGVSILPRPVLRTSLSRSFTPFQGARSVVALLQATCHQSPFSMPPIFDVGFTRQLGPGQLGRISWNSGTLFWPKFLTQNLRSIMRLGLESDAIVEMPGPSRCSIEFISHASHPLAIDDGEGTGRNSRHRKQHNTTATTPAGESWSFEVAASHGGGALSLTYGRNVFRGVVPPPPKSEWSEEGRHRSLSLETYEPRAVRLEAECSLSLDGTMTWTIRGSRKFGDLARVGVGVGVKGLRGLVISFRWNRLGQSIVLPVSVCPPTLVNADIVAASIAIPWITYIVLEYGVLRPRMKRKHARALHSRRAELVRIMEKRRFESSRAIALMDPRVRHRQAREEEKGGLVILEAWYGVARPRSVKHSRRRSKQNEDAGNLEIDVTIPVAALVHQSQLIIPGGVNKTQLIGFYDPAPLHAKRLRLRYLFAGKEHIVEMAEEDTLKCPMETHQRLR